MDESSIKEKAKHILDKFAKALEKVEKEHEEDSYVDREEFERTEGEGKNSSKGFKERMLSNAPKHDGDFIIGERGEWKWQVF